MSFRMDSIYPPRVYKSTIGKFMNAQPKTDHQEIRQPDQIAEQKKSCCCADRKASAAPVLPSAPTEVVSACCGGSHSHGNGSADGK